MGQYFRQVLRRSDTTQLFDGQCNGKDWNGLKLMEHSWIGNDFMNAMSQELHNNPARVIWCGDYADEPDDFANVGDWISYRDIWNAPEDKINKMPANVQFDYSHKFLVNHDKKVYVDFDLYISKCKDKDGWNVHPLSLLTAIGNGRGGGDYYDEYPDAYMVGTWAGDLLEVTDKIPFNYGLEDVRFIEDTGYDDDRI